MKKVVNPTSKYVSPSETYWEITGVKYKGNLHTYRLSDKMTEPMNQNKLAEFYEKEKQKGNPYPLDSILHFSIFDSAVKSGLRKYPNTLSRVIYNPLSKDNVIHNYGTSDVYSLNGDVIGEDGWITNINNKKSLELLTGIKDIKKLNKISQGVNQTQMGLWRVSSKPSEKIERVVRFDDYGGGLGLSAGGLPSGVFPAFLVEKVD